MPFFARLRLALAAVFLLVASHAATAAERRSFDAAAFAAAQNRGAPILIEISAPWCPTCRAQQPIIDEVVQLPRHKDLVVFTLDFDSQKAGLRQFDARSQSTLIAFRGKSETARSVGETNPQAIVALIDTTLAR